MKFLPITEWLPQYRRSELRRRRHRRYRPGRIAGSRGHGLRRHRRATAPSRTVRDGFWPVGIRDFRYKPPVGGVSPTSASSAILAATVAPLAAADPGKFMVLASAVTLVLGFLFLLAGFSSWLHLGLHFQAGAEGICIWCCPQHRDQTASEVDGHRCRKGPCVPAALAHFAPCQRSQSLDTGSRAGRARRADRGSIAGFPGFRERWWFSLAGSPFRELSNCIALVFISSAQIPAGLPHPGAASAYLGRMAGSRTSRSRPCTRTVR